MPRSEPYSLAEAAFILRASVDDIRRTVERKQIACQMVDLEGRKVRALDHKTLVFLNWARQHHADLKPSLWRKLYDSLRHQPGLPSHVDSGVFRASLSASTEEVRARLQRLEDLETQINRNAEGHVVIKGTDIEVHRVAALLDGGISPDAVLDDYPSLTPDQIAFAQAYAAAHPKAGRPFPKLTAKAALRQTDFSALDLDA